MFHRPPDAPVSRGQALVETALLLPVLALLLVMAVDFGRVFFGWVALQNAARVGADFAAGTANAWDGTPTDGASVRSRDRYLELIEADIRAINCALSGGTPPDPTFEDGIDVAPDDEGDYDEGDYAVVDLECSFSLITPLAESILGGSVNMLAHEEFPINTIVKVGIPPPPVLPECPNPDEAEVPDMVGVTLGAARDMWVDRGFDEDNFEPDVISTGNPRLRNVNKITTNQIPDDHNDCKPMASYAVTMEHQP